LDDHHASFAVQIRELLANRQVADLQPVFELALTDPAARKVLVAGLLATDEAYRYNCYKVLLKVAEHDPALLYPFWDPLAAMLDSENSYHRVAGVTFIARLVAADTERRFDRLCEGYFAHLDDDSVIVARYVAQNAARIVQARPQLAGQVTGRLLDIVHTYHNADRRDLLAADVIAYCAEILGLLPDKGHIAAFVRDQAQSKSPKARQAAKEFLAKQGDRETQIARRKA
jgi:hypothetical protein